MGRRRKRKESLGTGKIHHKLNKEELVHYLFQKNHYHHLMNLMKITQKVLLKVHIQKQILIQLHIMMKSQLYLLEKKKKVLCLSVSQCIYIIFYGQKKKKKKKKKKTVFFSINQ